MIHPSVAEIQSDQIAALSRQLDAEKHRNAQLILLNELSQQLETRLDQPVAAQLAMNTLERAIDCSYVCLLVHEAGTKRICCTCFSRTNGKNDSSPATGKT